MYKLILTSSKIPAPFMANSVTMLDPYLALRLSCTVLSVTRSAPEQRYSYAPSTPRNSRGMKRDPGKGRETVGIYM